MKRKIQLEDRLFPLQSCFNVLPDEHFIRRMQDLASGFGYDCTGCNLPDKDGEEGYPAEGYITFFTPHDEVTISYEEFLPHLDLMFLNYPPTH